MSRFSQTLFSSIRKTNKAVAFLSRHMVVLNLTLFVLTTTLALTYVVQVNSSANKGYQIRELEVAINQLELNNQSMQVKIAETRSMENVAAKVPMLGMVPASTPVYLSGYPATVSMNR
ncbi:MAG: hypothetical protein V1716_05520 [Candidatus Uhrbacteria bacterium]